MHAVSAENLGAWLLKANGDTSDIVQRAAHREDIRQWCVRPGYRAAMMRAGHRVLFWVAGSRRRLTAGIWAAGELTGPAVVDPGGKTRVSLLLQWLDEPARVPRDRLLADERLQGLEVLRQPQGANPSFVTVGQLEALSAHLDRLAGR